MTDHPLTDHPIEREMDYPVEGCECANCNYARLWETLSDEDKEKELESMAIYATEVETY